MSWHQGILLAGKAAGLLCAIAALSGAAQAQGFKADRERFFSKCARLSTYEQAPSGGVVPGRSFVANSSQLQGMRQLLDAWERLGDESPERLAFVLATARRESADRFQSIREAPGCGTNESCRELAIERMLAKRAKANGVAPRPNYALPAKNGQRYYGRGFSQITGEGNYRFAGGKLGLNLLDEPDLALRQDIAETLLIRGMLEGWFGNRRPLSKSIGATAQDFESARATINPNSPNKSVTAAYARDFLYCLQPQ